MAKKQTAGFQVRGMGTPGSFNAIPRDQAVRRLISADGTVMGDVSADAYDAVRSGKLDSYKPKDSAEKDVIDKFRNHQGFSVQTPDGTELAKVSYDAYNAIINDKLDTYNPKNDAEKKAIEDYKNYTGYGLTADKVNTQYNSNRYGKGNIDLKSRPMYENSDGSISTVRSISFNENGKEILIPTIIRDKNGNAKLLSDEEAIKHYHETGEYLGKFDSVNEANKYAMRLSIEQNLLYSSKYFVVANYVPSDNNMSKGEYNRRRASNPSMPEFGSYDYFKNREKVLKRYVDEISQDPDRQDDVIKAWAEGYANGTITKKHNHYELAKEYYEKFQYQDAIIAEYKDIDAQLKKFDKKGVHFDNSGNIDTKSGAAEAKYAKERMELIANVTANSITNDEMVFGVAGELPKERQEEYDSIQVIQGQKNVEAEKEKAYNYYAENKDNTYADDVWGRITGNYEIGYIGTKTNDAGFASYKANTDDLEAVEVYQALSSRIINRNQATFTNHGVVDETISIIAQYAPQAIQQEANKLVGKAIGAVVALSTGGGLSVRETANFFGSAFVANYMYKQTAGAAFVRNLQENGLSVEDAKLLATNEALASAAVEFGLDFATDRLWKGAGKATKGATSKLGAKTLKALTSIGISENGAKIIMNAAKNAGKVAIDALGEGAGEGIQEGISITADRYASEGKSASAFELLVNSFDLSKYSEDDFDRMNQSFLAGTLIGFGHGGLSAVTSLGANSVDKVISNVANAVDSKVLGEEIIASGETQIITDAVAMAKESTDTKVLKAAETVETAISEGKTPPAKAVGTVVKGVLTDEAIQASATVTAGDTFIDTKSNKIIKVLERTDTATKVEITTPDGKKEIKVVSNKQADQLISNETYKKVETTTVSKKENVDTAGKKNINLKRVGKYYATYGDEAVALAESLGVKTQKRNINGVATDVLLMPADLIEKAAQTMTDEFNFIFSDKQNATVSAISTESENALTTDENVATDETTTDGVANATEVDFNIVVETINDTLVPEAKDGILSGMNENGIDGGLVEFAKGLTRIYQKTGTLGGMEKFFTDKGERVMSAMEGRTEAVSEMETTTTPTEVEDTEVVESQTIPEMETADEVVAKSAIPTEVLKNEQKSDIIKEKETVADEVAQKKSEQSVEVGDEFYFPEENKTYRVTAKTKGSTSFEVTSADGSVITKRMSNNFIDKYFTDDKRVNKSSAEETSVEREDNGNERRSGILHDDGKRNDNESARKRDGKLSGVRRQNSERNETERREFARELREQGQTEQVTVENNTFELVNSEAYNDDMLAMVEEAKNRGEELGFFVGEGTVTIERKDGTKQQKNFDGVKTPDGKIYVQYDGRISPQTLYKHEHCHKKWRSLSMQKAKDKILGGLTEVEKKAILSTQRYQGYMTVYMDHYKGDVNKATDAVWEEFVCDVMSGMNDYVAKYSDVVNGYWSENESVGRYNPADYATETDAGGEIRYFVKTKYNEYNTLGMQWAYSSSTEIGDRKILFKSRIGKYVLVEATKTDIGFIELKTGSYKQLREDEKLYESNKQREFADNERDIDTAIYNFESGQNHHAGGNVDVRNRRTRIQDAEVSERKSKSNGTAYTQTSGGNLSKDFRYSISEEQNTDYMKAVENGDMETAQKLVDEVAEKAFSDSKVRGTDGKLLKVYHGTVNDFTVFKREFANIEGDFGKGYYFTSNEYDVDANYANEEGPDLKNKIARYAEQLEWNDEYSDLSYEEREEIARQKFITSEPNTITAYLNMENPVYITPDTKGTFLDFNEAYDEEYDEYGEPEGLFVDFIEALNDIASDYAYNDVNFDFLWERVYDEGGMYASDAVKIIKNNIVDELMDDNGDLAISEVIRLAFEQIGFDGIIDTSVYYKFRNMDGMDSGTTHYIVFDSEQIKSAEPVTYDDDGNIISLDDRFNKDNVDFRYSVSKPDNLKTQKRIEGIAEEIGSHEEFIELAKQNTQEFVGKIKENENLQKRLDNAKRQMLKSPKPAVNVVKVGKITQEILKEVDSTLNAKDLREEITSIYNEYFEAIKSAKGVEAKVKEANDVMLDRFSKLAVDIANSAEVFTESEEYEMLKSYIKNTRIKVPDSAKADAHSAESRKSHMGTFNLTNDGTDIDVVYEELCGLFPGKFDTSISHPADQLMEISKVLDGMKPYAYNPHLEYMNDVVEHIVNRFASEVDGLAVMPKTKAEKMAEKSAYDKEIALEKERKSFEQKLDKHKKDSEDVIRKLQKKIDDAKYVGYWEKRLSKEEKAQAVNKIREKRDIAILKTKIRNIVAGMKKNLDKTEKSGGYPKELVKTVADVCSVLDFHTDRTGKDGTPTKASLKLDALKTQYDNLKNNPNFDFQTEYSEELSDKILKLNNDVSGKRVIDLTIDELTNLKDILTEINHSLSIASKQIGRENALANMEIATDIINSLKLDNKAISEVRNQLLKEMKLAKEQGKAFVINPHRIFEMIANYDKNSEWWKLYDQILRGSRDAAKFTMDATVPFDELTDGGGNEIAFFDFRTKTHKTGIKYQDGTEVELPKSIICELVMLWDRKQGRSHLEAGGIKIPNLKLFNKGKTAEALASGKITRAITQSDITRLRGMLDSYDQAWIGKSRHLFNKVAKDAINETSMQLVGRELAKADNYIRIYVDSDFVRKDIGKEEGEITIEGHGSLKETTPDAKNPVVLRGLHENVYEHIDFASKYYGLAIPIRNFNKVYKIAINDNGNFNSVKNALGSVYGPKIRDGVVVQTIKDLQAPRPRELSFFTKVKGKWLGATFFANIRSTLKQTTSYWTAASILDEDSLAKGLVSYNKHRKQTKAEIAKYSGTLYKRAQGLSTTELGDRANRKRLAGASSKLTKLINEKAPILRKVPEWIRPGNWLQSMDVAVSSALWDACKHQVSKTMKSTDEGYMAAVRDLYERVIEETQSNYDVLHRPEVLKSTNAAWQTVGMFQTDNLQQTGIMYGAFGDLQAKRKAYKAHKNSVTEQNLKDAKKRMGKAIRSRIYSSVWLAAVTALGNALLRKFKPYIDDEEKEITAQSILEQMMVNMSEDMLSVFAPVLGQFVTKAVDTFTEDYDFISDPAFDVLEDFIKATSKIWDAYAGDGDVLKAWTDAIPAISNMTGIPAKNIMDLYTAVKGYIGDIKEGEFAHDLTDYSGGKSFYNYDDLASYIVSGDKEKEKKLLDYYSANGKEISQGSLTNSVKPAYVQMYVDSPKEAYNIKRKLILEYNFGEKTIDNWTIAEYFKHAIPGKKYDKDVVSDPEYASEIASTVQKEKGWQSKYYSTIRSQYKTVYKKENQTDIEALKKALAKDFQISTGDIKAWESAAEAELKKKADKQEAEKRKYE